MSSSTPVSETLPARMVMSAFAGMGAACFCHPFDVLRVQLQTFSTSASSGSGSTVSAAQNAVKSAVESAQSSQTQISKPGLFQVIQKIYYRDGIFGFYNGLSAAFLRQWMYGSGRMGIYSFLLADYKKRYPDTVGGPSMLAKMAMGATSGGIGSFIGTPSEVAIVRMAADSQLPVEKRRNYKHIFDCLRTIAKTEGFGTNGLYKGASVTVGRAVILTSTQMSTYSETKDYLSRNYAKFFPSGTCPQMVFVCSFNASLVCNAASMPLDVVKSRIQNMPSVKPGETPMYTGLVDCAKKSIAAEGPLVLWSGFMPAFVKLLPYTIISLNLLEKITFFFTGKEAL